MTLKRGSLKSFFNAERLSVSSTSGCMNAAKSEWNVSDSTGGNAAAIGAGDAVGGVDGSGASDETAGVAIVLDGTVASASAATARFRADQRVRNVARGAFSSFTIASVPPIAIGDVAIVRERIVTLHFPFRLGLVVEGDERPYPVENRRGHRDVVDALAAVEQPAGFVVADSHQNGSRRRHGVVARPPHHEHARRRRSHIQKVPFGL